MASYVISGLRVGSDLDLPGAIAVAPDAAPNDVTIAAGAVPDRLLDAGECGPNWQLAEDRFMLRVPGIVRLLLEHGNHITWQCEGDTPPDDAAIFVSGSGLGLLMHQRGRCVLHASGVVVGDRAVLFCGPSGAGKSTLAAALGERGHRLLADDQCVLSGIGAGAPLVHPDGRAIKLWQHAIDALALGQRSRAPVRAALRKFYVDPASSSGEALPLAAVYVLQETTPAHRIRLGRAIAVEPLNLADAARAVRANAYRPAIVRQMGQAGLYLQAAAAIAGQGGVFHLVRPLDFAQLGAVVEELTRHWRTLGLAEPAP